MGEGDRRGGIGGLSGWWRPMKGGEKRDTEVMDQFLRRGLTILEVSSWCEDGAVWW